MAARALLQVLLCMSLAAFLATPYCNAARSLRPSVTRALLSSPSVLEDDPDVPTNDIDGEAAPTDQNHGLEEQRSIPASEKDAEFNHWTRFETQEATPDDYNPPEANPDPGNPSPGIGD